MANSPTLFNGKLVSDLILNEKPYLCKPEAPVAEVVRQMQSRKIGSVVVVDADAKPIGIFTERDLMMKVYGNSQAKDSDSVQKYMTVNPQVIQVTDEMDRAARLMRVGRFRHLIIVEGSGKVVGVLSIKDLLEFMVDHQVEAKLA